MTTYLSVAICLTLLHATQQQLQHYERYCPTEQHCYLAPSHKSWSNAQQWCESVNATLPIVDTLEKQAELVEAMESMGLTEVWIGAMAFYGNWTWVDGTIYGGNMSQSTTTGDFVARLHPDPWLRPVPDPVVPFGSPAINSGSFICQYSNPETEACKEIEGRPSAATENVCYIVCYNFLLSWFSARNHCLENGGDLATFHNLSDAIALVDDIQPPWVGLRNRWWKWHNAVTGTSEEVLCTQWSSNEPSNTKGFNCISTTSSGWKETDCEQKLAFICHQQNNGFLPDNLTLSSDDRGESTAQIGSCKNVGLAAGFGVGIPLIVIAAILIVFIIKRDKLRTQKSVSSTTVYQRRSPNDNESVADAARNIQREQTQEGGAYEGLDSSQRTADDEAYEALDMQ